MKNLNNNQIIVVKSSDYTILNVFGPFDTMKKAEAFAKDATDVSVNNYYKHSQFESYYGTFTAIDMSKIDQFEFEDFERSDLETYLKKCPIIDPALFKSNDWFKIGQTIAQIDKALFDNINPETYTYDNYETLMEITLNEVDEITSKQGKEFIKGYKSIK